MKRLVIGICVLFLMFDLVDDGCLGKAKFSLPDSCATTSVTSTDHPDSDQTNYGHGPVLLDLAGRPRQADTQPVTRLVPPTILRIHCCHLGGAGGLPG
jgi:hypothetical protein